MAVGQTSRTQVRAYRFATRQMEWAVTQGDSLLPSDPGQLPRRWTMVSFFLALLLLAGFSVYGLIRPAPDWRSSTLIVETGSGTLYLNRDGVLYPALNMTSALLAMPDSSGARPEPKEVSAEDIGDAPRGALMGIPGAPDQLPAQDALAGGQWSVCDQLVPSDSATHASVITSTVVIGRQSPAPAISGEQAILATPAGGEDVYLLWDGQRSRIDLTDRVVTEALKLEGEQPRPVSIGLLNAIPEGAPITAPQIPRDNEATQTFTLFDDTGRPLPVGAVFRVPRVGDADTFYVVLADGVATITPTMADLLQFKHSLTSEVPTVKPEAMAQLSIPTQQFGANGILPADVPQLVEASADPLLCAAWDRSTAEADPKANLWTIGAGPDMPADLPMTSLGGTSAQAQVSQVSIAPGSGAVVSEWVPGQQPAEVDSQGQVTQQGQITKVYLVNDLGVAYPVASTTELGRLGFTTPVKIAPKVLLDLLPRGATLDQAAAQVLWDAFPDQMMSGTTLQETGGVTQTAPIGEATAPVTVTATS